jgi:hypothetical protein
MKHKTIKQLFLLIFIINPLISKSQSYQASGSCNRDKNINSNFDWANGFDYRNRNATFLIRAINSNCTGTIINRKVGQNQLGYYFISADHCFADDFTFTNNIGNQDVLFYFNFQSSDASETNIPFDNRGGYDYLRGNYSIRYTHRSRIRRVDSKGDLGIYEIIDPIPPHFDYYFAGWQAGNFGSFVLDAPLINAYQDLDGNLMLPHHPKGDIKKIAKPQARVSFSLSGGICNVFAEALDGLFHAIGCIFGGCGSVQTRIKTVCTYTQSPWYGISAFTHGVSEKGSSGSSLFKNNKTVGVLSGGPFGCDFVAVSNSVYRLDHAWSQSNPIRMVLDPSVQQVDAYSELDGREISCWTNNEFANYYGDIYPRNSYQPGDNTMYLKTNGNINTVGNNTDANHNHNLNRDGFYVHAGSSVVMEAGGNITLNPGAVLEGNVTLTPHKNCASNARIANAVEEKLSPLDIIRNKAQQNTAPKYPIFAFNERDFFKKINMDNNPLQLVAIPNPASNQVIFSFQLTQASNVKLVINDITGRNIAEVTNEYREIGVYQIPFDISNLNIGMYLFNIETDTQKETQRLVIQR